jgi:hypothetical protein
MTSDTMEIRQPATPVPERAGRSLEFWLSLLASFAAGAAATASAHITLPGPPSLLMMRTGVLIALSVGVLALTMWATRRGCEWVVARVSGMHLDTAERMYKQRCATEAALNGQQEMIAAFADAGRQDQALRHAIVAAAARMDRRFDEYQQAVAEAPGLAAVTTEVARQRGVLRELVEAVERVERRQVVDILETYDLGGRAKLDN